VDLQALQGAAAAAMLRLPEAVLGRMLRDGRTTVEGQTLDLRTQLLLQLMEMGGVRPMNELTIAQARREFEGDTGALGPSMRRMASVVDRTVAGPGGELPLRVYVPVHDGAGRLPALVFYHGGGWAIGSLDTHDRLARFLAADAGCVVVSVDYRLGPEHKFPAAVEDAVAAFDWVAENADELNVDAARIAIGGDSAGGNLAAVVSQSVAAADVRPCFQLLIYPVTDLRCDSASYISFENGFFLTRDLMHWFRGHYLSDPAEADDPRASPLLAADLTGVPPALVLTAGFDPLRDEGAAYAARLKEAGVEVAYRCYDGLIHGFASLSGPIPAGRAAVDDAAAGLRRALS